MAIKKSDLYSSLWASCDELRGGMDASQYKDYVLFMLFIKYVSDKYGDSDDFAPPVTIPKGASFKDMVALKGKSDIGDKINTQVIQPLIDANSRLARSDFPDFNDPNKLGEGQAMVERLTNLIGIFENPAARFLEEPRRARRHPRRCLRVSHAALRHRERQEQGAVLHPVRGQPHHRQGHRHLAGEHRGRHHRLRPHLRLRLAAAEGRRRGGQAHHPRRAGKGRDHRRSRPHEHDPARLPDGEHPLGQHARRSQVQGRRAAPHLRLRRRQSALLRQDLEHRPHPGQRPLPALRLGRAAEEAGRLRLPAAHHPLDEEHGQRRPAFCRTASSSGAMPRPSSARSSSAPATSRASSACRPTSFTAPASPPASWCSTRKTPPPARASS